MSLLYIAISLDFISLLIAVLIWVLGAYKDSIGLIILGWAIGVIGEFAAVIYSIMWIVWLFKQ